MTKLAICALFAAMLPAQEPHLTTVSVEHRNTYHVLGKVFTFSVTDARLNTSPSWRLPHADRLPLSVEKAVRISEAELRKYVSDPYRWRPSQIAIRALGKQSRWYYVIEWYPDWEGYVGDGIGIPILMTGEVVALEVAVDQTP